MDVDSALKQVEAIKAVAKLWNDEVAQRHAMKLIEAVARQNLEWLANIDRADAYEVNLWCTLHDLAHMATCDFLDPLNLRWVVEQMQSACETLINNYTGDV